MTTKSPSDARSPPTPLKIIKPSELTGEPPARSWIVENWIPCGVVTGLYGDGGMGKTLLAQQLQTSTALGMPWIGLPIEHVSSIGFYCEDSHEELWRRQVDINASYGVGFRDLGKMNWVSRQGEDNLLMVFPRSGAGELTPFYRQVRQAALDTKSKTVVIDTAADTFGGNENDRGEVRSYIARALGSIAMAIQGAVLLCLHPSRNGIGSGEGDGGSTGWSNTMRSRLFLRPPEPENGEAVDPNERVLSRRKANYAGRLDEVRIQWADGAFIRAGAERPGMTAAGRISPEDVFLALLDKFVRQARPVSSNARSGNFAPREFGRLTKAERHDYRQADFAHAMHALFNAGRIVNTPYGRKGDERTRIAVAQAE